MNVLFVSHMFPHPERPMFGTFVRDYADAIRRIGVNVQVIHLKTKLPWPINRLTRYTAGNVEASNNRRLSGVVMLPFPVLPGLTAFRAYSMRAQNELTRVLLESNSESKVDVVHAHNLFPDGALCLKGVQAINAPLVVTSHGSDSRVHIHRRARRKLVEQTLVKTDHLIAVSRKVLTELKEAGLNPASASVIYNGCAAHNGRASATPELRGRTVLAVCHLDLVEKGIDILIQAFGQLKAEPDFEDCRLVLVGGGKNAERLKALVGRTAANGSVFFTGPLEPAQVRERMAQCDLFCLPSWYEAFGIVYLEAMMHGVPVIAVRGQGIAEILTDNETGVLIEPRDVASCASALRYLLQDSEARNRIGAAGRKLASKFTWDNAAEQTVAIYRDMLAKARVADLPRSEISCGS
jgi:teichuronic acid biosynthesis glycosyltransferase TuaC